MTNKRVLILLMALVLALSAFAVVGCGDGKDEGGATDVTEGAKPEASGDPIKIGFNGGFSGFMAYDVEQTVEGVMTALADLDNQIAGRPVELVKVDNGSDPTGAVDKTRQMVENDEIDFMVAPVFSPSVQAVTGFLATASGIPQSSIMGQPNDNLETANKLAFIPAGLYVAHGYYFGKYCSETLGYKSTNAIHYDDTAAYDLQAGFEKGFAEGGGKVLSVNYTPMDAVDFSSWLSALKPADCTLFWVFGNGAVPFVKQYNDYGLTAPLVAPMSNNFSDEQLEELGDLGIGMVACDIYASTLEYPENAKFIESFQKLYPGKNPSPQAFQGWLAVMLFAKGVEATGGDTTPAKTIEAMSTLSMDTPAGKLTMQPFQDAYVPTRDFFIFEVQDIGDRITWVPLYTFEQVLLDE